MPFSLRVLTKQLLLAALCISTNPTHAAAPMRGSSLTPIATPSPGSSTFQYVKDVTCDSATMARLYQIYSKNRNFFNQCMTDSEYQIFPCTGIYPNSAQIRALVESPSCIAVFTAVQLANIPECDLSGTPLRSATETMLKLKVDIVDNGRKPPTSARFKQILDWRHAVNLAQAAGVPYDGHSWLYAEFSRNLWTALTNTSVQVFLDLSVVFILPNGTISRGSPEALREEGSGSHDDGNVVRVKAYHLDEESDVAVKVTEPSPSSSPSPTPSSETVLASNQTLNTIATQKSSSASGTKPVWWLGMTTLVAVIAALGV